MLGEFFILLASFCPYSLQPRCPPVNRYQSRRPLRLRPRETDIVMERVLRLVINDLILAQVILHPPLKRPDLVHQYLGVSGRDERRREVLEADFIELLARGREIRRRRGEC